VSFISTFFAEGFLRLARRAVDRGEVVKRSFFLQVCVGVWVWREGGEGRLEGAAGSPTGSSCRLRGGGGVEGAGGWGQEPGSLRGDVAQLLTAGGRRGLSGGPGPKGPGAGVKGCSLFLQVGGGGGRRGWGSGAGARGSEGRW
jgi:hypothetical protein